MLEDLYREVILKHYQSPANRREIESPDVTASASNPLCGDEITILAVIGADGSIADASFHARGCSISQASADMMADVVRGRSLVEAREAISRVEEMLVGGSDDVADLGELEALRSVRKFPVRIRCAMMAWETLRNGIDAYERRA
ncbi:MAG TPA: SUF system NifU family Fe-S cluster assembly protein [Chloroflexota bacterium]|nr:SUF system NifU family Fe-S cluster assembly protein [Chloroflexota bacterium]